MGFSDRRQLFKMQLSVLIIELLALIILMALGIYYSTSNGNWGVLVVIYLLAAMFAVSNIYGIKKMQLYLKLYKDYSGFKVTMTPVINEMRSTQHDLNNQLQTLKQTYALEDGHPDAAAFYKTLDGDMKMLSMFLKTDKVIINALLANQYAVARDKGIDLQVNCTNKQLQCKMDDFGLTSVLSNLIQNALETSPGDSVISLELTGDGDNTLIKISNPGKLDAKSPGDIFRMGYSSKSKNRGIGLYNVHRLVTGVGGRIEVILDSGLVTFLVILPYS